MNYKIRKILEGVVSLLQDFLYEAKKVVGAVCVRIMDDYGHIDNYTPSFAISLYIDYQV